MPTDEYQGEGTPVKGDDRWHVEDADESILEAIESVTKWAAEERGSNGISHTVEEGY